MPDTIHSESLIDLCRRLGGNLQGVRVYCVVNDAATNYVVAKSPGQAALAVTSVERVRERDLLQAALQAIADGAKKF